MSLRRIMRSIDLHSKRLAHDFGLTGPQLAVLKSLAWSGSVPVGELAAHVRLSHATVTGVLDRMEKRCLVKRIRGEADKRRVYADITGEGGKILQKAPPLLHEEFIEKFEQLEEWEKTMILSAFQRVADMMEARLPAPEGLLDADPQAQWAKKNLDAMPVGAAAEIPPHG